MANTIRKTSGRYRLVCLNKKRKVVTIACEPLTGKILSSTTKKVSGTDLSTLDIYILEHFKTKEDLCFYLNGLGYPVSLTDVCYFAYQHNGVTKYLELVYQNQQLHDLAVLCRQYKRRFSNYAFRNKMSSKDLRRLISKEISQEELWKNFYKTFISYIHEPDFYAYLMKEKLLDERALGFIYDYLNNESCADGEQQEAFRTAEYYLIDTFTAYKPIRGVIVSRTNYFDSMKNRGITSSHRLNPPRQKVSYLSNISPFELISETQRFQLEEHSYFDNLSRPEQEDFILSIFGLTKIPWYERTTYPVTPEQINELETQPDFLNLTYLEKIRYVNKLFAKKTKEDGQSPYQKKKV